MLVPIEDALRPRGGSCGLSFIPVWPCWIPTEAIPQLPSYGAHGVGCIDSTRFLNCNRALSFVVPAGPRYWGNINEKCGRGAVERRG
jgi:hypothetical protein